jgi:hypothetical protein
LYILIFQACLDDFLPRNQRSRISLFRYLLLVLVSVFSMSFELPVHLRRDCKDTQHF